MYKLMFMLNRVQIEMEQRDLPPTKVFQALKKIMMIERLALIIYFIFIVIFSLFFTEVLLEKSNRPDSIWFKVFKWIVTVLFVIFNLYLMKMFTQVAWYFVSLI